MTAMEIPRVRLGVRVAGLARALLLPILLVVEIGFFGATAPHFFSWGNFSNIIVSSSCLAILASGMTFIILLGGIDVSAGSVLGVVAWTAAKLSSEGVPAAVTFMVAIVVGAALGSLNGVLVILARIPPIIATLGTGALFATLQFLLWNSVDIYSGPIVPFLSKAAISGFPIIAVVIVVVYAVIFYLLRRRVWGRHLYAIGNDHEGARLLGIAVNRVTFSAYVAMGALAGLAGLIYVGLYGTVQSASGTEFTLIAIAAVIVGGSSVLGGEGGVLRTLGGVAFIALAQNAATLIGVPSLWDNVIVGVALLLAVGVDVAGRRLSTLRQNETR